MISDLEASVLGLICEGYGYGYEMEKIIEERNMRNWTEIAFSSIYYVLKRLEKNGYITSTTKAVRGRSRKVYTVTPQGSEAMKEKVKNLLSHYHHRPDPFDLGIGNLDKLPFDEIIANLRSYYESLEEREEFMRRRLEVMKKSEWPPHIHGLVTRHLTKLAPEKEWVLSYIDELETHHKDKEQLHGTR
jgi:DNA-binding PadR family transcriptional regulator